MPFSGVSEGYRAVGGTLSLVFRMARSPWEDESAVAYPPGNGERLGACRALIVTRRNLDFTNRLQRIDTARSWCARYPAARQRSATSLGRENVPFGPGSNPTTDSTASG